ncbi:MAG: amidohydrolase family protein, partial [Deltaproteobacteria bacterium]|nr:amidohydrolase family protein [Deltaproteobacteria bacterium]
PRRIPVKPVPEATAPTLIVKNGRIFDGSGKSACVDTLVIQGNKIKEIVKIGTAVWPDETRVIDASGKTVMPGMIDLHTHLSYVDLSAMDPHAFNEADGTLRGVEKCRYFIECGITSIRDMGSYGAIPFRLKEWIARKRIPGPRVFAVEAGVDMVEHTLPRTDESIRLMAEKGIEAIPTIVPYILIMNPA